MHHCITWQSQYHTMCLVGQHFECTSVRCCIILIIHGAIICCEWAGCEWKTRYEMQVEVNQLLEMQTASLIEKADETKRATKDGKSLNGVRYF